MSEYQLTEEEKEILAEIKNFEDKVADVPQDERIPVSNPDKYDFPIGIENDDSEIKE
jgi:hypothetical protein